MTKHRARRKTRDAARPVTTVSSQKYYALITNVALIPRYFYAGKSGPIVIKVHVDSVNPGPGADGNYDIEAFDHELPVSAARSWFAFCHVAECTLVSQMIKDG